MNQLKPVIAPEPIVTNPSPADTGSPAPASKLPLLLPILISSAITTIILAGIYFFYLAKPSPRVTSVPLPTASPVSSLDPTSDWQTYTSQFLSIRYPSDWVIDTTGIAIIHPKSNLNDSYPGISISTIDNPKDLTVKQYDEITSKEGMDPQLYSAYRGDTEVIASSKTINTITGYLMQDNNCEPLICDVFSFSANHKIYVIRNVYMSSDGKLPIAKEIMRSTFDQVLTTLKLGNSQAQQMDSTQYNGWMTYTNPIRHYSIKYPEFWKLDSSKAETSLEDIDGAMLNISNDKYIIKIIWPSAYGPQICIFDDQSRQGVPEIASNCEGQFTELANGERRRLSQPEIINDLAKWNIYSKSKQYFVTLPPITYTAPLKYDEQEIKIMDEILSSYQQI